MKTKNLKIIFICILFLGVTACSSDRKTIEAKYISIYKESSYLVFDKDGSFKNSLWTVIDGDKETINDCFTYTIDANGIITVIDTTEYEGQDSLNEYEIGIMYKDYICVRWNGTLSKDYTDASITNTLGEDLVLTFNLKEDKTYEFVITSGGEVVNNENGTYLINDNEVICTSDEGEITTFVSIEGNTYCVEYIKE